jgi:hypothetical protein
MKTRVIVSVVVVSGVALLSALSAWAHHGFSAEYDANRPVKVQGKVVKVEWVNPHSWFHLDVDGEMWAMEGGNPSALSRRGFTKNYLSPGTEIIAEGFMSKGLPRRFNGRSIRFPDGRTLFIGSSGTGAPVDGTDPTEGR